MPPPPLTTVPEAVAAGGVGAVSVGAASVGAAAAAAGAAAGVQVTYFFFHCSVFYFSFSSFILGCIIYFYRICFSKFFFWLSCICINHSMLFSERHFLNIIFIMFQGGKPKNGKPKQKKKESSSSSSSSSDD